jgi:hypothetical protein
MEVPPNLPLLPDPNLWQTDPRTYNAMMKAHVEAGRQAETLLGIPDDMPYTNIPDVFFPPIMMGMPGFIGFSAALNRCSKYTYPESLSIKHETWMIPSGEPTSKNQFVGVFTLGSAGRWLRPKNLDTTSPPPQQTVEEPITLYQIRSHHSWLNRKGHQPKRNQIWE